MKQVPVVCPREPAAQGRRRAAMSQMHLSARGFHRVLKLARTIADLAGAESIAAAHVAEGGCSTGLEQGLCRQYNGYLQGRLA